MEILQCIKESLLEQASSYGVDVIDTDSVNDIIYKMPINKTTQGYLYWNILYNSYKYTGEYDYITIIKLYHKYDKGVFKYIISCDYCYSSNQSEAKGTPFDSLCLIIDLYNLRKNSKIVTNSIYGYKI